MTKKAKQISVIVGLIGMVCFFIGLPMFWYALNDCPTCPLYINETLAQIGFALMSLGFLSIAPFLMPNSNETTK